MESTVKKELADLWTVRVEGRWAANIFMDDTLGLICIYSDYGNYSHWWGQSGRGTKTLSEFLLKTGVEYLKDKFSYGAERYFDSDKTIERIKQDIIQKRRERGFRRASQYRELSKEDARELWDEIEWADWPDKLSDFYWVLNQDASKTFEMIYGNDHSSVPCITGYQPQLVAFMERVWPVFMAGLEEHRRKNETENLA